jgi:hypothetical protein
MYEVDGKDVVVELEEVPQPSVGAPIPIVLAGEHDVLLTYYLDTSSEWDGETIRSVGPNTEGEPVLIVKFAACTAHMFGAPNDEAFTGHPLADRGLRPYAIFEVKNLSWIRKLERMNSVHPYHDKKLFLEKRRHFVFAFHDTTFECVAHGFTFNVKTGSVRSMVPLMLEALG